MVNIDNNSMLHKVTVLMEHEGVEIAPFIWYDFDTDSSELLITCGQGCPVYSCFLKAWPQLYPLPPFTRHERLLFHQFKLFTPDPSQ